MKKYFLFVIVFCTAVTLHSQEYIGQKSFAGITAGILSYAGMYSKDASFLSHTSMSFSGFYSRKFILPKQLYIRGELMAGEIAGDNTNGIQSTDLSKGAFRGYLLEASAKAEYEILNSYASRISPYVMAGGGAYYLFDYEPKQGEEKTMNESWGFVLPVGAGVKYRLSDRVRVFAEGSMRFFPKNLDNYPDKSASNPNQYYTLVVGASFSLQRFNRLW